MKVRKSVTIDSDTNRQIEEQAVKETRSFSNMIEQMAKEYLITLKESENNKKP